MDREQLLGDVGQGKVGHGGVVRRHPADTRRLVGGPGQVAVGQHHGLGRPGGPRGVDQGRHPVRLQGVHPFVHLLGRGLVPLGQELLPGHDDVVVDGLDAAHHHHMLELGQVGQLLEHLGPLALVLEQDHRRLGVVEDVLDLGRGAGDVDPRRRRAHGDGAHVEDHPLGAVEAQDADPIAGLDPQRDERPRGLADLIGVRAPGGRLPGAAVLLVVGGDVAAGLGLGEQACRSRIGHVGTPPRRDERTA